MSTPIPAGSLRPTRTSTLQVGSTEITLQDRDRTRPFLLLLEDTATHTPLFLAQVTDPARP